ncbi:hypothetical protein A2797_00760 [candidate division WWE3 bacterium RIFCSPHIGHO2_01_FULL_48_15]|uniref:HD/PDEase domain-containing protein n=1 Tax=candidate division WWE3 bacterium RIFCSPHIGHO2_01_FULL_48_15 TaxID=1802619 RepID=A0A1F4VCD6_UNCKA|nr:MAG: hypothetical protein A2797_00760 [candidate division WWE3 bacterium RIFCSPHIGHO2_01_FULL_48_15]
MPKGSKNHFEHFLDRSLSHVIRFSGNPQHFHETVGEHSFYVAYFTAILSHFLKKKGVKIDEAKAMKIALVHDMEESFSGDIRGPFKHRSKEVLDAIRKAGREIIPLVFDDLPADLGKEFVSLWKEDTQQKTIEAQVVKAADELSLIAKCHEEAKVGNEFFRPIYERHLEKLRETKHPWWKEIKDQILPTS